MNASEPMDGRLLVRVLLIAGNVLGALAIVYPFTSETVRRFLLELEEFPWPLIAIMAAVFVPLCANGMSMAWSLLVGTVSRPIGFTLQAASIIGACLCAIIAFGGIFFTGFPPAHVVFFLCLSMIFIADSLFLWRVGHILRLTRRFRPIANSAG